jgi:hypothetical protein
MDSNQGEGVMFLMLFLSGCLIDSDDPSEETSGVPGAENCNVVSSRTLTSDEAPSFGPSADEVVATLDGIVRRTLLEQEDLPEQVWEEELTFGFALDGPPIQAEIEPWGIEGEPCISGDFVFAPVQIELAGTHFSASGPGFLKWRGPDLDEDLFLFAPMEEVVPDDWLVERAETLLALHSSSCSPEVQQIGFTAREINAGLHPWSSQLVSGSVTAVDCAIDLGSNNGLWLE